MRSLVLACALSTLVGCSIAAGTILTDEAGRKSHRYTPTEEPVEGKSYWLVIGVADAEGAGAAGIASWAQDDGPGILLRAKFSECYSGSGVPPLFRSTSGGTPLLPSNELRKGDAWKYRWPGSRW